MNKKSLGIGLLLGLLLVLVVAFVPSLTDFNANQFGTANKNVTIKNAAAITNMQGWAGITANSGDIVSGAGNVTANLTLFGAGLSVGNVTITSGAGSALVDAGALKMSLPTASRAAVFDSQGQLTNAAGTPTGSLFLRDDNTYAAVPAGGPTTSNNIPVALILLSTSASSNCYMMDLNVGTDADLIATNGFGLLWTNGANKQSFGWTVYQGTVGNWTGVLLNNTGGTQTNRVGFGVAGDITVMALTTNAGSWDIFKGRFLSGVVGAINTTNKIDITGAVRAYQ